MAAVKEYGQFCALARALDQIGDRWTLLVVRQLLIRPATYTALQRALPGVATNLLAERLRALQDDGLVARLATDATRAPYALTARGAALRPVVLALIRWGAPLMERGPGDDAVDDGWAILALEALLTSTAYLGPKGRLRITCGDVVLDVVADEQGRRVEERAGVRPGAHATGPLPAVLASAYRGSPSPRVKVTGSRRLARSLLDGNLSGASGRPLHHSAALRRTTGT
ncbi:MAG TPA: helix-turn-helix domain-containing protein [Mycobacteriales bacterium]|nr:helix-turn-helix domain-containing protein [Mycobacteriales bacterium]